MKRHSTNYTNALIAPAADCPVAKATAPANSGTLAALQHARLIDAPYVLTSDDLLSAVQAARKQIPDDALPEFRADFFSKGQPCLRASPLTKTLGWAVHHDADARIALVDPASERFADLSADPSIKTYPAMRNKRA